MTLFAPSDRVQHILQHSLRPSTRPPAGMISLASGEPDFDTPQHIRTAHTDALKAGATHYAAWNGAPELREALARHAGGPSRPSRPVRTADHVLVTHGGSGALAATILACVNPGDRVIIPVPTYSLYADLVRMAGGQPVLVPQQDNLHLDLDAIAKAAPGARMVAICNPCNPTGIVYSAQELTRLRDIAEQHGLLVLADEAYDHIVYNPAQFTSVLDIPRLAERVLYVQTFSKTYAMTGWRIGYLIARPDVVTAAAVVHTRMAGPLNTAVQHAALAALTGPQEPVQRMLDEYRARREVVTQVLGDVPGTQLRSPDGTFYTFIAHTPRLTSVQVATKAREWGVAVRPGSEFGGEGYIRLSFATDRKTLTNGLERLRDMFAATQA
ncbi:pyridoxal phosphate-dependent aminotransferase [Streptomyces sp. NPDC008343]|uniref:pyridoxal phosphate-dependent aminotransferase n=1 Tax=Streptomyces sp. NPDC008343 TaxID=3364828 RepID=UPI0036E9D213